MVAHNTHLFTDLSMRYVGKQVEYEEEEKGRRGTMGKRDQRVDTISVHGE